MLVRKRTWRMKRLFLPSLQVLSPNSPRCKAVKLVEEEDAGRSSRGPGESLPHRRLTWPDVLRQEFGTLQSPVQHNIASGMNQMILTQNNPIIPCKSIPLRQCSWLCTPLRQHWRRGSCLCPAARRAGYRIGPSTDIVIAVLKGTYLFRNFS